MCRGDRSFLLSLLRGAELLQMKKRLKDEFGGGLREFCFAEANCFLAVERKKEFLNNQERAVIVRNLLYAIEADEGGEELRSSDESNNTLVTFREGQAIGKRISFDALIAYEAVKWIL